MKLKLVTQYEMNRTNKQFDYHFWNRFLHYITRIDYIFIYRIN